MRSLDALQGAEGTGLYPESDIFVEGIPYNVSTVEAIYTVLLRKTIHF